MVKSDGKSNFMKNLKENYFKHLFKVEQCITLHYKKNYNDAYKFNKHL